MAFAAGTRQWVRGTIAKISASSVVLGSGELLVDESGGVYGGDGSTVISALSRVARVVEMTAAIAAQAAADAAKYATQTAMTAALNAKADLVGGKVAVGQLDTYGIATSAALTAAFASPAQVNSTVQAIVGAAPAALSTLQAIDAQLANDESAASALTTQVTANGSAIATLQGQVSTNTSAIAAIYNGGTVA